MYLNVLIQLRQDGQSTASSATVPSGNIVSQDPAGGIKVPRGTSVDLVVSTGPAEGPVSVPDVVGMTEVQAEVTLSAAGLTVGDVSYASSNVVAAGLVISQDPAAEVSVSPRTAVDILGPTVLKPSKKILL